MKRTALWLPLVLLVIVAGLLAASAGATTTPIPVSSYVETDVSVVAGPTAVWQSGNILHTRGLVLQGHHFGSPYLTGWNTLTVNENLNLVTGAAEDWGTFVFQLDGIDGITGGWTGTWNSNGGGGKGDGGLAGWHVQLRFVPEGLAGFVFSPADK